MHKTFILGYWTNPHIEIKKQICKIQWTGTYTSEELLFYIYIFTADGTKREIKESSRKENAIPHLRRKIKGIQRKVKFLLGEDAQIKLAREGNHLWYH